MLTIHCKRLNDRAIIPTKAHRTDAGWDLYCDEDVTITNVPTRVRTGICLSIPQGYYGQIQGRSGLAMRGVVVRGVECEPYTDPNTWLEIDHEFRLGGVIDSSYRGEVLVLLSTLQSVKPVHFRDGDKVAQLVILPVPESQMVDVGTRDLPHGERGKSGFGDSDRKVTVKSGPFEDPSTWGDSDRKKAYFGLDAYEASIKAGIPLMEKECPFPGKDVPPVRGNHGSSQDVQSVQVTPEGARGTITIHGQTFPVYGVKYEGNTIQDAPGKPQDAPDEASEGPKVESPQSSEESPRAAFSGYLFAEPAVASHPSGWLNQAMEDAKASYIRKAAEELAKQSVELAPKFIPGVGWSDAPMSTPMESMKWIRDQHRQTPGFEESTMEDLRNTLSITRMQVRSQGEQINHLRDALGDAHRKLAHQDDQVAKLKVERDDLWKAKEELSRRARMANDVQFNNATILESLAEILDFIEDLDDCSPNRRPWSLVESGPKSYWKALKAAYDALGRECPWSEPNDDDDDDDYEPISDPDTPKRIADLEADNQCLEDDLNITRDALEASREQCDRLTRSLQEAQGKIAVLESAQGKELVSKRIYMVAKQLQLATQKKLDETQSRVREVISENQKLDETIGVLHQKIEMLESRVEILRDQTEKLKALREEALEENSKLRGELAQSQQNPESIRRLQKTLDVVMSRASESDQDYNELDMKYRSLCKLFDTQSAELNRCHQRITNDATERDRLLSESNGLKGEIGKLRATSTDSLKQHLNSLLDVIQVIKPRFLEPAQWDVINGCYDALGRSSPFFGGTNIGPQVG